ncbi:hypothetical protein OF83DRAFT_849842, partial [Amylostereum chailletii]
MLTPPSFSAPPPECSYLRRRLHREPYRIYYLYASYAPSCLRSARNNIGAGAPFSIAAYVVPLMPTLPTPHHTPRSKASLLVARVRPIQKGMDPQQTKARSRVLAPRRALLCANFDHEWRGVGTACDLPTVKMVNPSARAPFIGPKRRLVLAFDLGTTFSGVSYAVLDPDQVPEIMTVTRFPGQEAGDSKIPTVIYYDAAGRVLAVGAEEPAMVVGDEEDDDWEETAEPLKVEWFKLLLRPSTSTTTEDIPHATLPASKDIVAVYADFYAYLYERARAYITETHANGDL